MELKKNINILRISFISQIILLIIIIILSAYYKYNIDWMSEISLIFFFILFYCLIAMIAPPVIFFIIIFFKKNYNIFFKILKITISLFIIRIIITIEFLVIFIITNNNFDLFYKYCPFNFKESDITRIFPNLINNNMNINVEEIKNDCINKKCFEFNNAIPYSFICNFNLGESFNEKEYRKIDLKDIKNNNISEIILSYINLCIPYTDIFICNLFKKPKKFSIDIDYKCPKNKSSVLEIIITLLNIIFPLSIFVFQFIHYKKILKLIVSQEIQNINKTVDSSNKSYKSNKSFKKEKTEFIIVDNDFENKNEEYLMTILKNSKENTNRKKPIRIYKVNLLYKDKDNENIFIENLKTINPKHNRNKSFTENKKEFNINGNIKNDFEENTNRLLTELNKNNKEEKQVEDKAKYIVIKK